MCVCVCLRWFSHRVCVCLSVYICTYIFCLVHICVCLHACVRAFVCSLRVHLFARAMWHHFVCVIARVCVDVCMCLCPLACLCVHVCACERARSAICVLNTNWCVQIVCALKAVSRKVLFYEQASLGFNFSRHARAKTQCSAKRDPKFYRCRPWSLDLANWPPNKPTGHEPARNHDSPCPFQFCKNQVACNTYIWASKGSIWPFCHYRVDPCLSMNHLSVWAQICVFGKNAKSSMGIARLRFF